MRSLHPPADSQHLKRLVQALDAVFQLCLTRFAVRAVPEDIESCKGVSKLEANHLIAIALVNEAWQGGQLKFESVENEQGLHQAHPSHYLRLDDAVSVPGQVSALQIRTVAEALDRANDLDRGQTRKDRLGCEPLAGRIRQVIGEERRSLGRHWRGVMVSAGHDRDALLAQAVALYQALRLPVVVTDAPSPGIVDRADQRLRETGAFLEGQVLSYLSHLDRFIPHQSAA